MTLLPARGRGCRGGKEQGPAPRLSSGSLFRVVFLGSWGRRRLCAGFFRESRGSSPLVLEKAKEICN